MSCLLRSIAGAGLVAAAWASPALSGTVTFAPPVPLTASSAFESDVSLTVDVSGLAHVLYRLNDGDPEVFYLRNPGGAWGQPVRLTSNDTLDQFLVIAALATGEAVAAWQTHGPDREVVCQRVADGTPAGPLINVTDNEVADDILALAAAGSDRWVLLTLRETPAVDELVVWEVDASGSRTESVVALGLQQRFLFGLIAVGPDGVIHVAARVAPIKGGSLPRLAHTSNRGGAFAPLRTVLADASGSDLGLHVDDAGLVYAHARTATNAQVAISMDGGETFATVLDLGAMDVQHVVGRPGGVDVFQLVAIDNLMRLHRVTGPALEGVFEVPTPGWRSGDIQFHGGVHFAITTGTLQFTSTSPAPAALSGDVNLDGVLDAGDVVWLVNVLTSGFPLTLAQLINADFNGDLVVDGSDLTALVSALAGGL